MCRTKTETLAVVHEFTFFTGKSNGSETFCTLLMYKFFKFSYFVRIFLELQKFTKPPYYYRLSCFRQILISMCCLLILMNLWVVSEGMNHREVGTQYILHQYEFIMISKEYLSGYLFSYTNGAYEFSVKFCVVKFSSFG